MGLFSKLKFWGKKDDFGFDSPSGLDKDPFATSPTLSEKPFGGDDPALATKHPLPSQSPYGQPSSFSQPDLAPSSPPAPPVQSSNDLDLINSKLDTIKAMLNSMDQRLANVEKSSGHQVKEKLW
ncbi:TPA: hypothetical protein HA278_00600 [Candidatus Woesearchaeota archaeon]|jgi:hypothetical protein|nr:hypothetical protein [Candidatus Woesearchaeota archaeon]